MLIIKVKDLNKWTDIPCSWIRRLIVNPHQTDILVQHNSDQKLPSPQKKKNPARFSINADKIILKFLWKGTETRRAKVILEKSNKMEEITLTHSRTYYRATVIKTVYIVLVEGTE